MKHKHPHKHSLLLDECLPVRKHFPRLNSFHKLTHVVEDYKLNELKDPKVYQLACKQKLLLVTLNKKHFTKIVQKNGAGIIGISGNMTPDQIDNKLFSYLKRHSPQQLQGKYSQVTNNTQNNTTRHF